MDHIWYWLHSKIDVFLNIKKTKLAQSLSNKETSCMSLQKLRFIYSNVINHFNMTSKIT